MTQIHSYWSWRYCIPIILLALSCNGCTFQCGCLGVDGMCRGQDCGDSFVCCPNDPACQPTPKPTLKPTPKPTKIPTPSPTATPTDSPTAGPIPPPTTAVPTNSPTICRLHDIGLSKFSNDGKEQSEQNMILQLSLYPLNNNKINYASSIAEYAAQTITPFINDDIQEIQCTNIVSCYQSSIYFYNNTICNILCNNTLSCTESSITIRQCNNIHLICNG
eukprot:265036_1